jgi:hypothetical protein
VIVNVNTYVNVHICDCERVYLHEIYFFFVNDRFFKNIWNLLCPTAWRKALDIRAVLCPTAWRKPSDITAVGPTSRPVKRLTFLMSDMRIWPSEIAYVRRQPSDNTISDP